MERMDEVCAMLDELESCIEGLAARLDSLVERADALHMACMETGPDGEIADVDVNGEVLE